MIKYYSYAKINLGLSILGLKKDGYHEVATLMTPIDLADIVHVEAKGRGGIHIFCPGLPGLSPKDNLAYKAAMSLTSSTFESKGVAITIEKTIPPGTGLGGGSSNAAATLLAIRDLLYKKYKFDTSILLKKGAEIGSDVPFFIGPNSTPPMWGTALCTGRGVKVRPVDSCRYWIVLVLPHIHVSTRASYSYWDSLNPSARIFSKQVDFDNAIQMDPRIVQLMQALTSCSPKRLGLTIYNDFEESVYACYPKLSIIREKLLLSGAFGATLTGSGSGIYAVCSSRGHAEDVKNRLIGMLDKGLFAKIVIARTGVNMG